MSRTSRFKTQETQELCTPAVNKLLQVPERVEEAYVVPNHRASQIENDVTIEYMRRYGYRNVRGGDYTYSKNDGSTWWLPREFREIAERDNMSISTHSGAASEQSAPSPSAMLPPSRFLRRRRSSSKRV